MFTCTTSSTYGPSAGDGGSHGTMIVTRFADDLVIGFELKADAHRFLDMMRHRFESSRLSLHPGKTRLSSSAVSRYITANNAASASRRPSISGLHAISGKTRRGSFQLKRKPARPHASKIQRNQGGAAPATTPSHSPTRAMASKQVVRGFFAYHAVPTNMPALTAFLRANDDETNTCREFTLGGIGQTSSGYAQNQRQQDSCSSRR